MVEAEQPDHTDDGDEANDREITGSDGRPEFMKILRQSLHTVLRVGQQGVPSSGWRD